MYKLNECSISFIREREKRKKERHWELSLMREHILLPAFLPFIGLVFFLSFVFSYLLSYLNEKGTFVNVCFLEVLLMEL